MTAATALKWAENGPAPHSAPKKNTDTLKQRFSALILRYPVKRVAEIADCSTETVKNWRACRQMPQVEHMFRLANALGEVHAFVIDEIGDAPRHDAAAIVGALQELALSGEGQEAAIARAVLGKLSGR